jgi:hypothetical protein
MALPVDDRPRHTTVRLVAVHPTSKAIDAGGKSGSAVRIVPKETDAGVKRNPAAADEGTGVALHRNQRGSL